jgi:ketopantoate hydroxymethyltransferase
MAEQIESAVKGYITDIKSGDFPMHLNHIKGQTAATSIFAAPNRAYDV